MAVTPPGETALYHWAEKALNRGATHLVLRLQAAPDLQVLYAWAKRWQGVPWIVHGRWAKAFYGHGMHFPADEGMPPPKPSPFYLYGASCHNFLEIERVSGWADYVWLGAIFPTASHPERLPLQLATLREAVRRFPELPILAIGGLVSQARIEAVRAAGAAGFASIRYFTGG